MPKVLRIINRLNLGGPTFNAAYLSKYLAPKYETLLVAGMKDESEASSEFITNQLGLKPRFVKHMYRSLNPFKDYKSYKELKSIIREFKPDIVHTHAAKPGAVGRLAAHHCKVPVILHTFHGHVFHSYFGKTKTKLFIKIEQFLAKRSTRLIAISPIQKKEIGEQFKIAAPEKIALVRLGFDLSRFSDRVNEKRQSFRNKYQLDEQTIAIGIVGRLVPIKDHFLFLRAFQTLLEQSQRKLRAFIIGDGESRMEIEAFARELDIPFSTEKDNQHNEALVFTSWIKEVDWAYAGLDLVALTSKNEGTPVSLIEAQAAKKPIVATKVGGLPDVAEENVSALLSPAGDAEALAKNFLKIVEDDALRVRLSQGGFDFVNEKYSYQRLVSDMDKLYSQLLAEKSRLL